MANKDNKTDGNVPGKYYVDTACTGCATCSAMAPDHFKLNDEATSAHVFKQPATPEEETTCGDAKTSCPEEAIGDDGE